MNLITKLPPIRRAREFRLYSENNRRIIDLWRADGLALFGYKKSNLILNLKNNLEKGVLPAYPSIELTRLKKAIKIWREDCLDFVIFPSLFEAQCLLDLSKKDYKIVHPLDSLPKNKLALLLLPFAVNNAPVVIAQTGSDIIPKELRDQGDVILTPFIAVGATRSIYDWIKLLPSLTQADFKWWDKAIEKIVQDGECPQFEREGVRLWYKGEAKDYAKLFESALEQNVFLSPQYGCPSYLPLELSGGERDLLIRVLINKNH